MINPSSYLCQMKSQNLQLPIPREFHFLNQVILNDSTDDHDEKNCNRALRFKIDCATTAAAAVNQNVGTGCTISQNNGCAVRGQSDGQEIVFSPCDSSDGQKWNIVARQ